MLGNDLIVSTSQGPGSKSIVYAAKSCTIQTDVELQEAASPSTGAWKEFIPGRKWCVVNTSYLVSETSFDEDLLKIGTQVDLSCQARGGTRKVTGKAYVKTCSITATRGNLAQGSFVFWVSGELSR